MPAPKPGASGAQGQTLLHFAPVPQNSPNALKNQLLGYKNDCEIKYELYTELLRRRNEKNLSFSLQRAEYRHLLSSWRGQVLVEMQMLCDVFTINPLSLRVRTGTSANMR